jgi:hypothetical protein
MRYFLNLKRNSRLVRHIPLGYLGLCLLFILGKFCELYIVRILFLDGNGHKRSRAIGWGIYSRICTGYKLVLGLINPHAYLEFNSSKAAMGSVSEFPETQSDLRSNYANLINCDFLVVGAGPGGLAAATELRLEGYDVLIVESGHGTNLQSLDCTLQEAMENSWVNFGRNYLIGDPNISVLQGQGIGGSSAISGMIIHPLSENLLGLIAQYLNAKHFQTSLSELKRVEDMWHKNLNVSGSLNVFGADSKGKYLPQMKTMPRAVKGCRDSGLCLIGCPNSGKNSLDQNLFSELRGNGCRFLFDHKVTSINSHSLTALVAANGQSTSKRQLQVQANHGILLAAGAIETPRLVIRSKIDAPQVGLNLKLNLGPSAAFVYPDSRIGRERLAMGLELFHKEGKISTQSLPPELLAARIWPFTLKPSQTFGELANVGVWTATIPSDGKGIVFEKNKGFKVGEFALTVTDRRNITNAVDVLQDLGNELGAQRVVPLMGSLGSSHLFGTLSNSGPRLARNVFAVDASILPMALGVNPILAIMTASSVITQHIIRECKSR